MFLIKLLLAYILADLFTGLYHVITDKGWNIKSQVRDFQTHHLLNTVEWHIIFRPMYFALPIICIVVYLRLIFIAEFAVFAGLTEICHYYAHSLSSKPILIKLLQYCKIILPPALHKKHHTANNFTKDYCVLSGWCNPIVNVIARRIPERAI